MMIYKAMQQGANATAGSVVKAELECAPGK